MLLHNNHDGTFTDVTDRAGVANERWGVGVAVRDYDNDGWPDIYVANYGNNRLYHNNHNGTFTDVAEKPAWIWEDGRLGLRGGIMTGMANSICSSRATSSSI